jgi:chorismate synthase
MLRFLTAGESHGNSLSVIVEGIPAGVSLQMEDVNRDLRRRQISYGRGGRMEIEEDTVDITAGLRWGKTLGSPLCLVIANKDWVNWQVKMSILEEDKDDSLWVTRPRPGHADLAGALKYNQKDVRNILERSSARETAARVTVGAVCKAFLQAFAIKFYSYTKSIGGIEADYSGIPFGEIVSRAEKSELRCAIEETANKMKKKIDEARQKGDTLGGVAEIVVMGLPPGLGSHVHWERKLDGRIAQSLLSIQAVKGVEIGLGFESAQRFGSQVHDEIFYETPSRDKRPWGFFHKTNNAGGIEGGMTNGEPLVVRCAMKPIATLMQPLTSVDLLTKEPVKAAVERSDVCRVSSLGVIGESVVAFEIARAFLEKFGGDSVDDIRSHYHQYLERVKNF